MHAALTIGLVLLGAVFFFLLRVQKRPLGGVPSIGLVLAAVALAILMASLAFLRGKVPARRSDQSPEDYWQTTDNRARAILLWTGIQSAGILSWFGYVMSGQLAPAAVALIVIVALIVVRPARLEGDG
jgi:hypothetical protein